MNLIAALIIGVLGPTGPCTGICGPSGPPTGFQPPGPPLTLVSYTIPLNLAGPVPAPGAALVRSDRRAGEPHRERVQAADSREDATAAKGEGHGSEGSSSRVGDERARRILADPFAAAFDGLGDC